MTVARDTPAHRRIAKLEVELQRAADRHTEIYRELIEAKASQVKLTPKSTARMRPTKRRTKI